MDYGTIGIQNDKMFAEILTGNTHNTPNTPKFKRPICPNRPIIWDIFEKNPYHMSIVHDFYYKGPT